MSPRSSLDRIFEPAHRKLGHVFHDGYWLTRDELSAVQGLIKHKGRWVSPEEKAKIDRDDQVAATQANWLRTIKILRQAVVNGLLTAGARPRRNSWPSAIPTRSGP